MAQVFKSIKDIPDVQEPEEVFKYKPGDYVLAATPYDKNSDYVFKARINKSIPASERKSKWNYPGSGALFNPNDRPYNATYLNADGSDYKEDLLREDKVKSYSEYLKYIQDKQLEENQKSMSDFFYNRR